MKYFLLETDDRTPQPHFLDWYNEMQPKKQTSGDIPRLNSFTVKLSREAAFADIVTYPYFMLSKDFSNLVRAYDDGIRFKYAILYDRENRRHYTYGMPMLETVDCLAPESEFNRDHSVLHKGVLREEAVRGRALFQLGGVKNRYIAGSLELIESAFRREVTGLSIRELSIK